MAYWEVKLLVPTATPDRHNSQPTGFSGLREATMAPTVASTTTSALPSHQSKTWTFGYRRMRARIRRLRPVNTTEIAHNDQASRAAARVLIFPPRDPPASAITTRGPDAPSPRRPRAT